MPLMFHNRVVWKWAHSYWFCLKSTKYFKNQVEPNENQNRKIDNKIIVCAAKFFEIVT